MNSTASKHRPAACCAVSDQRRWPTAAVVEDDHVVFNTESCELEVLTMEGKSVWKRWLVTHS